MSAPTSADGRIRFPLCSNSGCGEARITKAELMAGTVEQIAGMIEEDASAQAILLGTFEKRELRQRVADAQRALLAAEDDR